MTRTVIVHCVNCDKYITDIRESCLVLEQNMKVISQIEQWISPRILTKTDNLCQACWNLVKEVINMKNEPSDDEIQPGNSHTDDDTDPLKVKTEIPSPSNEETETSHINNMFEKDPLKLEPEDNDEKNKAELPNSERELETQLTNSQYESEQNVYLSNSDNEETENNYISAKRKKLDTHITTCSNIEEIKDHDYAKQKETTKDSDDPHDAEKKQALRKGCPGCGRSILRKPSRLISYENPTETQQLITNVILASVTREVTVYDRVCFACYSKYYRCAKNKQNENASNVVDSTSRTNTINTNEHIDKKQDQTNVVAQSDQNDTSVNSDPDWVPRTKLKADDNVHSKKQSTPYELKAQIQLPNYKRAPSSSSSCLFFGCKIGTRHHLKEDLRIRILLDYNYYIPVHCRICSFHLISNNWDKLFDNQNSMSTFYSAQIEDLFHLLKKAESQANFDNILSVDDNLLQYLIGMNKKKFFDLLNEVPEVKNIRRGVCGLVAVLIRHYRHESHAKIASVMNISRKTIEGLMKAVNEALSKRGDILEAYVSSEIYSRCAYKKQN